MRRKCQQYILSGKKFTKLWYDFLESIPCPLAFPGLLSSTSHWMAQSCLSIVCILHRRRDPRETWCWGRTGQVFWALLKPLCPTCDAEEKRVLCRGKTEVLVITCVEQRLLQISMSLGLLGDVESCRGHCWGRQQTRLPFQILLQAVQ